MELFVDDLVECHGDVRVRAMMVPCCWREFRLLTAALAFIAILWVSASMTVRFVQALSARPRFQASHWTIFFSQFKSILIMKSEQQQHHKMLFAAVQHSTVARSLIGLGGCAMLHQLCLKILKKSWHSLSVVYAIRYTTGNEILCVKLQKFLVLPKLSKSHCTKSMATCALKLEKLKFGNEAASRLLRFCLAL